MTETNFVRRAQMVGARAGIASKDDPAAVAKAVPTLKDRVMPNAADMLPDTAAARTHRGLSGPGSSGKGNGASLIAGAAATGLGLALASGWRNLAAPWRPDGGNRGSATAKGGISRDGSPLQRVE